MSVPLTAKAKLITAVILIVVIAAWLAGLSAFIRDISALPQPTATDKLDAVVVLTGGSNRIDAGFGLLKQGAGKKLFISGVYRGLDVKQLLKKWKAEPQNTLDCCVALGFEATSTTGNAAETADWMHKEGFHTLYLVTANYHIRRAVLEFNRIAPDMAVTPYPIVPEKSDMWLISREYMKYVAAYVRSLILL